MLIVGLPPFQHCTVFLTLQNRDPPVALTKRWYVALRFRDNFYNTLAEPRHLSFCIEGKKLATKNLAPGLNEVLDLCFNLTKGDDVAATTLMTQYAGNMLSIGLRSHTGNPTPGSTRRSGFSLPTATTSAIQTAWRARSSVSSLLFVLDQSSRRKVYPFRIAGEYIHIFCKFQSSLLLAVVLQAFGCLLFLRLLHGSGH